MTTGRTPYTDPVTEPGIVVPPPGPAAGPDGSAAPSRPTPPSAPDRVPSDPGPAAGPASPRAGWLLAVAIGALVAVALGVYGRIHEPALFAVNIAGFSSSLAAKSWLATIAFVLALVQVVSAMIMYGRFPSITAPSWIGTLHRWSGRAAVLVTVPVAVHCLYALGFEYHEPRVLVHSLFGCFFYGVFVTKMLLLTRNDAPKWSLPVFGGAVFTALVVLWLTSSVFYFSTRGIVF
ncbi:MAG: DUF6529 family protein [Pseudonocardia sp.]|nr:DUF6529 family protein [Pseudonocardia sp.]